MVFKPTHYLDCRHAIGRNGKYYRMYCVILKIMSNNRLKIRVFGDRFWPGRYDKSYIRYVPNTHVHPINFKLPENIPYPSIV